MENEKKGEKKKVKKAGLNRDLAELIAGKTDPTAIAEIVQRWQSRRSRKRDTTTRRREYIYSIINGSKKLSLTQMDALAWEYAMSNNASFAAWLDSKHPELFKSAEEASEGSSPTHERVDLVSEH